MVANEEKKKGKTDVSRIILWIQENLEDEITSFYVFPTRFGLMHIMEAVESYLEEILAQSKYRLSETTIELTYYHFSRILCDALRPVDYDVCVDTIQNTFIRKREGFRINWKMVYIDATRRFRIREE